MEVPLLNLKVQYARIKDDIRQALDRVLESQSFILGPEVEALELEIAAYSGTRFAVGVSSGTEGLLVALMALDIGPGDEVATTPFSFFATAGAIARLRAVLVFVDIDRVTFNLNPALLEKAITPKTKAILLVHLFGQCADMDPILAIARKYKVPVIKDACQSIGAEYMVRKAGSIGDIGVHFFDMLTWIFGVAGKSHVHMKTPICAAGFLELENADVRWFLSLSCDDLPAHVRAEAKRTYRCVTIDDLPLEFSEGSGGLHTKSYEQILKGDGLGLEENRPQVEIVHGIKSQSLDPTKGEFHPAVRSILQRESKDV